MDTALALKPQFLSGSAHRALLKHGSGAQPEEHDFAYRHNNIAGQPARHVEGVDMPLADLKRAWRRACMALRAAALALLLPQGAMAQLSVGDGGTPSFSQAIAVPPGVGGMSPKLSLYYAGGGVNGPLGHGWSVQGLSVITRCAATQAQDGRRAGVAYQPSDKLCLDGQRLFQTDESGDTAPASGKNAVGVAVTTQTNDAQGLGPNLYREFRTEKDMYARIRAYGYANCDTNGADPPTNCDTTGASGPAYFRVWTKAGQIYDYGLSPSFGAQALALIAPPKKPPIAWAVSRISDTLGNFIDFKYEQRDLNWGSGPTAGLPTPGHEWNILEIQYSRNKVVFNYDLDAQGNDVRTDKSEAYQLGNKNVSARRLKSITTYVNSPASALGANGGTAVRTTQLSYEYGATTGRSRINKIQDCAGGPSSNRCLPPSALKYAEGGNEAYQANTTFAGSSLASLDLIGNGTNGVLLGDFDGDGKTDILYWSDTPANNKLYLSKGDGSFTLSTGFNITAANLFKSDGCYYSIPADFNGDGVTDVLQVMRATSLDGRNASCGTVTNVLYLGSNKGAFVPVTLPSAIDLTQRTSTTKDRYDCLQPVSKTYIPKCTEPGDTWLGKQQTPGAGFHLIDVDGDGNLDIVTTILPGFSATTNPPNEATQCASIVCTHVYMGSASGTFTEKNATNLTHHSVYGDPPASYEFFRKPFVADFNGDGLQDLLVSTGLWLSNGDGTFSFKQSDSYALGCANSIDFNGDGRSDCLNASWTASYQSMAVGDGTFTYSNTATFNLTNKGQELSDASYDTNSGTFSQTVGMQVIDINGDGRQDILRWKDDSKQNAVYLSNGDGSFTPSTTFNLAGIQLQKSDGTVRFLTGDFTGRGTAEFLTLQTVSGTATNRLYTKVDPTPADQLFSVTSPSGLTSKLYYVPLSNSTPLPGASDLSLGARYQSDLGNTDYAVLNAVDLSLPMYVVATQVNDTGVGTGALATELSYRGLKADRSGRGMLGFRQVLRQRPGADGTSAMAATPITVDTRYVQVHPYIGVAASTSTYRSTLDAISNPYNAALLLLSSTSNVYCDQTNVAAASASANCPVTAKVARPYLYQSVESGKDLYSIDLPTVTTLNTFNGSGDPATILVTTTGTVAGVSQTFTKLVSNTYDTDKTSCSDFRTCNWILGRLSQATVTNKVPYSLKDFPSSSGNGTYAAAIAGSGPPVAPPLSFVLSNCTGTTPTLSPTPASYVCTLSNTGTASAVGLSYTSTSKSLVVNGPTSCAANTANCGSVTMQTPATAGAYTGKFTVSSAGASVSSANITLNVSAPSGLAVSIASFNPTTVVAGGSSSFNWSTSNATSASVSCTGTGVTVTGNASGISGSVTVGTTVATTTANCTVTATGPSGASVAGGADLTVLPSGTVNVSSASFSTPSVVAGDSGSFSWTTANAASASVSCSGAGATATGSGVSGTISVSTASAGTATCIVTANDGAGNTATGSANLTVTQPPFDVQLSLSKAQITGADTVVATSSVSGQGATCTASSSPSTGWAGGFSLSAGQSGSATPISVSATTTFTLTCVSSITQTSLTRSATVTYAPAAPVVTGSSFNAAYVTVYGTSTFSWTVSNATSSSASCSGNVSGSATGSATGGSLTVTAGSSAGLGTCTVTATGAGGTATGSSTINVVLPAGVSSSGFSPAQVTPGTSSTFSWTTAYATSANVVCKGTGVTVSGTTAGLSGSVTVSTTVAATDVGCTVTAINAAGQPVTSSTGLPVIPISVPAASVTSVSFSAPTVTTGASPTFAWNTSNASTVGVSCAGTVSGSYVGSLVNSNFAVSTAGSGSGSCTVTPYNSLGVAGTAASATLSVVPPPSVSSLSFSQSSVTAGGSSAFSWSTANATSASVACAGTGVTVSGTTTGLSGNVTVSTTSATTAASCTVTANNAAGTSVTSNASLTVTPIPGTFSYISSTHTAPGSSGDTVTFNIKNTGGGTLTGIGMVSCTGGSFHPQGSGPSSLASGATGQWQCQAAASGGPGGATLTLTATNATNSPFVATEVAPAASVTSLGFSASTVTSGATPTFAWSTSNASSVSVSCSGTVSGSYAGSLVNSNTAVNTSGSGSGSCTVTPYNSLGVAGAAASASLSVVPPPTVSSLGFSPTSVIVGGSSTFSWTTANATSATVACSGAGATASGSGTSGSLSVGTNNIGMASCSVTAINAAGSSISASSDLSVYPPPPTVTSSLSATTLTVGGQAIFSWNASNASSVVISCTGAASGNWSGNSLVNGINASGVSAGTGTCTVTATNFYGATATSSKTLTVVPPPSVTIAAFSPSNVVAGGSSTFSWTTANATSATVACSGAGATASSSGTSGNLAVGTTSAGTATCTVTSVNAAGTSASAIGNLNVVLPTPTVTSSLNASTITVGGQAIFSWNASNASSVAISCTGATSGSWSGTSLVNGIYANGVSAGTGTCTVTATNSAGVTATSSSTLTVVPPPSVTSATFNPTSVLVGGSSTFSWTTANATSATVACSGAGATASGSGTSGNLAVGTSSVGTASCTVTAVNAAGTSASAGGNLSVVPPPFDAQLSLSKTQISGLDTVFLTTTVSGQSANCTASSSTTWNGSFAMAANTSASSSGVQVSATTTFYLQCTSTSTGAVVNRSATVTLVPPAVALTVSGPSGSTWTFANPNSTAQIITAIGLQFGANGDTMGAVVAGGTCAVNGSVAAGGSCTVLVRAPASDCRLDNYSVAPVLATAAGSTTGGWLSKSSSQTVCP